MKSEIRSSRERELKFGADVRTETDRSPLYPGSVTVVVVNTVLVGMWFFISMLQCGSPDHTMGRKQLSKHGGIKPPVDHPAQEV